MVNRSQRRALMDNAFARRFRIKSGFSDFGKRYETEQKRLKFFYRVVYGFTFLRRICRSAIAL